MIGDPYVAGARRPRRLSADSVPAEKVEEFKALLPSVMNCKHVCRMANSQKIYAGTFEQPKSTHRLHRGDPMQPREEVLPAAIAAVGPPLSLAADAPEHQRRLALAHWIGDAANPLTARVLVNRLWHYHFGQGLVEHAEQFRLSRWESIASRTARLAGQRIYRPRRQHEGDAPADYAFSHLSAGESSQTRKPWQLMPTVDCCGASRRAPGSRADSRFHSGRQRALDLRMGGPGLRSVRAQ